MTPNYANRADKELAHIRKAVEGLPLFLRHRIINRCDKLAILYRNQQRRIPEADNRTPAQQADQVAAQYNTARAILAALIAGRVLSQRDSREFKTTAFHSRMCDVRRILSRQFPEYTLCSRFTDAERTDAGRPYKLYWLETR